MNHYRWILHSFPPPFFLFYAEVLPLNFFVSNLHIFDALCFQNLLKQDIFEAVLPIYSIISCSSGKNIDIFEWLFIYSFQLSSSVSPPFCVCVCVCCCVVMLCWDQIQNSRALKASIVFGSSKTSAFPLSYAYLPCFG